MLMKEVTEGHIAKSILQKMLSTDRLLGNLLLEEPMQRQRLLQCQHDRSMCVCRYLRTHTHACAGY